MYAFLRDLDRRWVFLLMFLAVAVPILSSVTFPEDPSDMVRDVFHAVEDMPNGSRVLMAFDYDPGSKGELTPMAAAFTRHCAEKGHKMYFLCLWPLGVPMIQENIAILEREYPHLTYGEDYVNFGFYAGNEGVIINAAVDLKNLIASDYTGINLNDLPMTKELKNIQEMDLVISVSAGDPGTKQWVQYACSPYGIDIVAGCTGVQAPQLYPYIPEQLIGVLGAIKAAAEYEQTLVEAYDKFKDLPAAKEGLRRMGPQLIAHLLIVGLILTANVIYFMGKARGDVR